MLEITEINGYRIGSYIIKDQEVGVPCLLELHKDHMEMDGVRLPKPLSYPFRDMMGDGEHGIVPLLRISKGAPLNMAKKIQTRNKELNGSGDIVPVFLSGYAELDDEVIEGLDAKIYMFDLEDERTLLNAYFRIRKRHPEALCFCNCGPDELPVLAYAGFDIFPETEENKAALERLMLERSPQYIEMMACSSIRSKTLLDLLYHAHWAEFEPFLATPRNRELYISRDAFWRPNTQKWVEDIKEGYMPQSNVFLLLPCSSRKPYSSSQSHRSFISLTRSVLGKGYASLCQLIITSPYGVVPRDLESLIDYDIVVTGKWLPEEISRSRDVLSSIISKTDNPVVIAHLPENELETIKELEADVIVTTRGHPLSEESMRNLKETLESVKGDLPPPKDRYGDIRRFSEHIYGKDIFPESIYVKGKGIRQVFSEGVPFASLIWGIRPTNGDIEVSKKYVDIENFELKGDLFCVGVREAEDGIRAGDEVVIRNDGKTVAVGTAVLPGCMMKKIRKGKAVKIRKRFH